MIFPGVEIFFFFFLGFHDFVVVVPEVGNPVLLLKWGQGGMLVTEKLTINVKLPLLPMQ